MRKAYRYIPFSLSSPLVHEPNLREAEAVDIRLINSVGAADIHVLWVSELHVVLNLTFEESMYVPYSTVRSTGKCVQTRRP